MGGNWTVSRMARLALFALVLGGAVLIRYSWQPVAAVVKPSAEREAAPDFSLRERQRRRGEAGGLQRQGRPP
jgi:hypothetical protein